MRYGVLGPLEVSHGGRAVPIPAGKPRALLTYLLLHANQVVSSEALVDALWPDDPPPTASKIVQNYVSQLRKSLGGGALITEGRGYRLEVAPGELDLLSFERLVQEGRETLRRNDCAAAASTLLNALDLWRGAPIADVAANGVLAAEVARLDELRFESTEDLIEARLGIGEHEEVVAELDRLVRIQPLRERPSRLLMIALYRCGRHADALAVYADFRRRLADDLGLEPSRTLQELERAVLNQDPALEAARRPQHPLVRRPGWNARLLVFGGAALIVAASAAVVGSVRDDDPGLARVSPNAAGLVDADGSRIVGEVPVPNGPARVAAHSGLVWVASTSSNVITGIDERAISVSTVVATGIDVADVAASAEAVWVVDRRARTLVEVDPAYGQVARRVQLPIQRGATVERTAPAAPRVAAAPGVVWVTNGTTRLLRVDARTGVTTDVDVGVALDAVATGPAGTWVVSGPSAVAIRVDPRSGKPLGRIPISGRADALAPFPTALAVGERAVWVLNANTATLTRIDPELRAVVATTALGVDSAPVDVAAGREAAWVIDRGNGSAVRVDAGSGEVSELRLGQDPAAVAVASSGTWVAVRRGLVSEVEAPRAALGATGDLPPTLCSRVRFEGGEQPDALVAVPLSLQGFGAQASAQILEGIRLVFERRAYRAGRLTVGFQACNDADRASGFPTSERCALNARTYVAHRRVLGVVGPVYSTCAQAMLPILNAAPGGPLPIVSGLNTYVGLTRAGPLAAPGEPEAYYPSGRRSYLRVTANDAAQSAAAAELVRRRGVRRVFVLDEGTDYGAAVARGFASAVRRTGIEIAGRATWNQAAPSFGGLARRIKASGADGAFLAGAFRPDGTLLVDLRRVLGPDVTLVGSDGFQIVFKELENLGREVEGLYVLSVGVPVDELPPVGGRFVTELERRLGRRVEWFTVQSVAATEVMLDALARSNGTRGSVLRELFRTRFANGILGPIAFTPSGDVRRAAVTVHRIVRHRDTIAGVIRPS